MKAIDFNTDTTTRFAENFGDNSSLFERNEYVYKYDANSTVDLSLTLNVFLGGMVLTYQS